MTAVLLEDSKDVCGLNCEAAGAPRLRPQGRSLDKGIHLATSETKHGLANKLRSRTSDVAKGKGRVRLHSTLITSLTIMASRDQEADMCDAWEGRRQRDRGPCGPRRTCGVSLSVRRSGGASSRPAAIRPLWPFRLAVIIAYVPSVRPSDSSAIAGLFARCSRRWRIPRFSP
jgi:hypothetical protein